MGILEDIKLAYPRFSMPTEKAKYDRLVYLWQQALGNGAYPPHVYQEALTVYMRDSKADDNPPTAGDILRSCKKAIDLIEQDPVRRKKLYAWREKRREERDRALAQNHS